jgi:hypothetical protein
MPLDSSQSARSCYLGKKTSIPAGYHDLAAISASTATAGGLTFNNNVEACCHRPEPTGDGSDAPDELWRGQPVNEWDVKGTRITKIR